MNKNILIVILIVIALFIGILVGRYVLDSDSGVTGNVVLNERKNYTWTTAICDDESNKCIDVLIECVDGKVMSIKPVSNLTEFSDKWSDPRVNGVRYCE